MTTEPAGVEAVKVELFGQSTPSTVQGKTSVTASESGSNGVAVQVIASNAVGLTGVTPMSTTQARIGH